MKLLTKSVGNSQKRRANPDRSGRWVRSLAALAALALALQPEAALAKASFGQASDIFNVGAGARSMGMGSAFTGLADDASAPYFNPAGLAFMDEHQLMVMHAPLFMDSNYDYIASAHPFGDKWGAVAISDAVLMSRGFEIRNASNFKVGTDNLTDNSIFGSYAHKINQALAAGVNAKFIQQKIAGFSGDNLGLDAGFLYRPLPIFRLGAFFSNFNAPKITLDQFGATYRPVARVGLASEVFPNKLILSADYIHVQQEDTLYAFGAEFTPNKFVALRAGYNQNRSYTLGMGVNLKPFRIDYAFSDTDLGAFNKVSFTWAWYNIYKTDVQPPEKDGRAVYPLQGFENSVVFKTIVPGHVVSRWTLQIKDHEGKEVRTLSGDLRPPEEIVWDAKNAVGEPVVDGKYLYTFNVAYKNGKSWTNVGDLNLDLPDHQQKEVIDMNLELNGARQSELTDPNAAKAEAAQKDVKPVQAPDMTPETPALPEDQSQAQPAGNAGGGSTAPAAAPQATDQSQKSSDRTDANTGGATAPAEAPSTDSSQKASEHTDSATSGTAATAPAEASQPTDQSTDQSQKQPEQTENATGGSAATAPAQAPQ